MSDETRAWWDDDMCIDCGETLAECSERSSTPGACWRWDEEADGDSE